MTSTASTPTSPKKIRVHHLRQMKQRGEPIAMLTAYDILSARIFDAAGIEVLLIGDSIGDNMHGHATTLPVTVDDMVLATRSVSRGAERALVVADLPFGSYEAGADQALATSVRLMKEGGAHVVKLEGGRERLAQIRTITDAGIPVFGHLGFTPQHENLLGGKRIQGRGDDGQRILDDALAIQDAGAVAVVLEMTPGEVAERVTAALEIPTIGIGAGNGCDGQVLVWLDMAGMTDWSPSFARRFAELGTALQSAAADYTAAVKDRSYPSPDHTFGL